MSLGTLARLSFTVLAFLSLAGGASAQLFVQTTEIEGSQSRLDSASGAIAPFSGTMPLPAPPAPITFDASHTGSWFLDYGLACAGASTIWGSQPGNEFGATRVNVGFADTFSITAPGQSGTGFVDVLLEIGGQLSAGDGSSSRSGYKAELFLAGDLFQTKEWFGECSGFSGPDVCTGNHVIGDPFGSYPMQGEGPIRVQFTFGQPITLDARLEAHGEAAQSELGQATGEPSLRWLGFAQVLDASMQPVGSYSVSSFSGADLSEAFDGECGSVGPDHDLALGRLKQKKVSLSAARPSVASSIGLQLQNRGAHDETIPDQMTLESLVSLTVESLGACPVPAATLLPPRNGFPVVLAPNKKLSLTYLLTFDCANDPLASSRTEDHSDFRVSADVDHSVLGAPDGAPANDVCPRAASGRDKGCGPRTGGDILIDVIVR